MVPIQDEGLPQKVEILIRQLGSLIQEGLVPFCVEFLIVEKGSLAEEGFSIL